MYLEDFYESVSIFEDAALIGREFSACGCEYAVLGFVNGGEVTYLAFLEYEDHSGDEGCGGEYESLTNRELILADQNAALTVPDLLQEIVVGGKRLEFDSVLGQGGIDEADADNVYLISKFLEKGWRSKKFFSYPPERVSLYQAVLAEKQESLSALDLSDIKLLVGQDRKCRFPDLKLDLEIDKALDIKIPLFEGENELHIKRVSLVGFDEIGEIEGELQRKFVKDRKIPVIEYTCDCELESLSIATTQLLNANHGDRADGLLAEGGVLYIHFGYDGKRDNGEKTMYYTIQEAVPAQARVLECELLCYSKEIKAPCKEIML